MISSKIDIQSVEKEVIPPYIIKTNFKINHNYFNNSFCFDEGWENSNFLYRDYISKATQGKSMKKFYVKPVKKMDVKSLKLLISLFKIFSIKPKNFRCDFFKVLPGGSLPYHIDQKSKISLCLPLTINTSFTCFKRDNDDLRIKYDSLILLNNLVMHKVTSPTLKRMIFRVGVHDITFEEVLDGHGK